MANECEVDVQDDINLEEEASCNVGDRYKEVVDKDKEEFIVLLYHL